MQNVPKTSLLKPAECIHPVVRLAFFIMRTVGQLHNSNTQLNKFTQLSCARQHVTNIMGNFKAVQSKNCFVCMNNYVTYFIIHMYVNSITMIMEKEWSVGMKAKT